MKHIMTRVSHADHTYSHSTASGMPPLKIISIITGLLGSPSTADVFSRVKYCLQEASRVNSRCPNFTYAITSVLVPELMNPDPAVD